MPEQSILQFPRVTDALRGRAAALSRPTAQAGLHRSAPRVRIRLLEDLVLYVGDSELPLHSRKAQALVAYLVLTPGMKDSSDRLAGLFWSESEDVKARASLRQLLHVLHATFEAAGVKALSADRSHVSLDASLFKSDLDEVLASVDRGVPTDTLVNEANLTDLFLRGYEDIDPSFHTWLTIKREGVRQMVIGKLEAQLAGPSHNPEALKRIARALSQIDPTHEIACQKLMQACIDSGNPGGALAAYRQLWHCLEEEYDIEPSTATQGLAVAIKSGCVSPAGSSSVDRVDDNAGGTSDADPVLSLAIKLALSWITKWEAGRAVEPSSIRLCAR
jgi:DNA-binding SARP family transcriptional activator